MRSSLTILVITYFALLISSLPLTSTSAKAKSLPEFEIRMSMPCSQHVTVCTMGHRIKKRIEEITSGRAKVKIFWSSSLVPLKDHYRALQSGLVDLAFVNTGLSPGVFPLTELFQIPGIAARIPASNLALMELFRMYPDFEKQFSSKVKYISTSQFLLSDLHSKKPIRRLKDLKGLRIGCQTAQAAQALNQLGASASTIAWTDMYMQLERGVVDGVVAAWGIVNITRLHEVAKNHTLLRLTPALAHWLFNRNIWNKFTPEEQKKLKLLEPWINYATVTSVALTSHNMRSKEITLEKGHTTIEFPKEDREKIKKLFSPLWNKWAVKMEKKGYPGKAILKDALRLTAAYSYE